MSRTEMITEADLHAYVDGNLDADRRAAVEAHIADHERDGLRVAAWIEQADTLRALYGHVADEPVPPRLAVRHLARERTRAVRRGVMATAAAVLLLLAGAGGGWLGRGILMPDATELALVSEAEAAHALYTPEVLHPVEVSGDDSVHLTKWLSKRLDRNLAIPDLASEGFHLIGGRLLPAAASAAAQLMYENRDGARVTLYVVPTSGEETGMRLNQQAGLTAVSWRVETLGCVLVGDLPRETLLTLAKASYGTLDPGSSI